MSEVQVLDALSHNCVLEKFRLYETRQRFYLIGSDANKHHWRVLKLDRSEPSELNISEDPVTYTQQECKDLLQRIADGNRATGGLLFVTKAFGIVGCIKFLESYYLILVTKRRQVGCICGHAIYGIDKSQLITIPHSSVQTDIAHSKVETRYKKLLSSVDLTKDFFYSYTYPIMQSLQRNVLADETQKMPHENMFVWNAYLRRAIRQRLNNLCWTVALVHGSFEQAKMSIFGRVFVVTLISRRSRHFAGTRYLKRGVNDKGRVANDVETEQIIIKEEAGISQWEMSSVVQMRGSIPLFWSQEASRLSPKPDIILQRYDPTYQATKLHFDDVAKRYGNPIIVLNLIKTVEKRPREMMLRREFANAVGYLNQILPPESRLQFIHWDYHKFAKSKSANVLAVLGSVANQALDRAGFYYSGKPSVVKRRPHQLSVSNSSREAIRGRISPLRDYGSSLTNVKSSSTSNAGSVKANTNPETATRKEDEKEKRREPRFQSGVLRTNCIDCIDRTNVAQYAYGLVALGRQLYALGLTDIPKVDFDSSIAGALMAMYQNMGDALALQYGGSAAHNTVFPEWQGKWKATTQSEEFLKSIKRYYSNAYTDGEKQDAINLFLGYFQPQDGKPALWELDSDYYLHVGNTGDDSNGFDSWSLLEKSEQVMSRHITAISLCSISSDSCGHHRTKLTSFDKLMQTSCGSIKSVRMCSEPDTKSKQAMSIAGTAPDAAEIQLKSPVWLFGQHQQVDESSLPSSADKSLPTLSETSQNNKMDVLNQLFSFDTTCDEEIFRKYLETASTDNDDWYGSGLLPGTVEDSEAYRHYSQFCQVADLDPFDQSTLNADDFLQDYTGVGLDTSDEPIAAAMESALNEFNDIGKNLGSIVSIKGDSDDASSLTLWILNGRKQQ